MKWITFDGHGKNPTLLLFAARTDALRGTLGIQSAWLGTLPDKSIGGSRLDAHLVDYRMCAHGHHVAITGDAFPVAWCDEFGKNVHYLQQSLRVSFSGRLFHCIGHGEMESAPQAGLKYREPDGHQREHDHFRVHAGKLYHQHVDIEYGHDLDDAAHCGFRRIAIG